MKNIAMLLLALMTLSATAQNTSEIIVNEGETFVIDKETPKTLNKLVLQNNSTLTVSSDLQEIKMVVDSLIMGKNVVINTRGIDGNNGISYTTAPPRSQHSSGRGGTKGGNGENGTDGKDVFIQANVVHFVKFQLITDGGHGGHGGKGQNGGKGANASCPDKHGRNGGKGGNGGNGGNGGSAGKVLITFNSFQILIDPETGSVCPNPISWIGKGGNAGEGGNAGTGGPGGNSGCCLECPWPASGCCSKVSGGNRGDNGSWGYSGVHGLDQAYDKPGWFRYHSDGSN